MFFSLDEEELSDEASVGFLSVCADQAATVCSGSGSNPVIATGCENLQVVAVVDPVVCDASAGSPRDAVQPHVDMQQMPSTEEVRDWYKSQVAGHLFDFDDIDALLNKYEGNERSLYLLVCKKYFLDPLSPFEA